MEATRWRPALLGTCAFVFATLVASVFANTGFPGSAPWVGKFGMAMNASGFPFEIAVRHVNRGGPTERAGVRDGDRIAVRGNPAATNLRLFYGAFNGESQVLNLKRGATARSVTLVPAAEPTGWDFWLSVFDDALFVAFATLIAWRRAHVPQMRTLALLMLAGVMSTTAFATPSPFASLAFSAASSLCGLTGALLWAIFAGTFARPLSPARRATQRIVYLLAVVSVVELLFVAFAVVTLWTDPVPLFFSPLAGIPYALMVASALAASVLAIRACGGVERQQALWTLVPLGIIFCGIQVIANGAALLPASSALDFAENATIAIMILASGFALTYAAVSRKLIDIGFVLNRAAVFGIVSTIVIGAFVVVSGLPANGSSTPATRPVSSRGPSWHWGSAYRCATSTASWTAAWTAYSFESGTRTKPRCATSRVRPRT